MEFTKCMGIMIVIYCLTVVAIGKHGKHRKQKPTKVKDCTAKAMAAMAGWDEHFRNLDFEKGATYYTEDFYYLSSGIESLLNRSGPKLWNSLPLGVFIDYYKKFRKNYPDFEFEVSIPEAFCLGDDVIVGTCIYQLSMAPGHFGRALMVWTRNSEGRFVLFKEALTGPGLPVTADEFTNYWGVQEARFSISD